jgi:hypothetical protein
MALYFFHLRNGIDVLLDPDGRRLAFAGVPGAALGEARAIIAADARAGRIDLDQSIEVQDSEGEVVHRIAFEDAVKINRSAKAEA